MQTMLVKEQESTIRDVSNSGGKKRRNIEMTHLQVRPCTSNLFEIKRQFFNVNFKF